VNEYTASNGITIWVRDGGTVQFQHGTREESCGILQVFPHSEWWETLREFFRAEEDERLGRWRWPEHPEYVVYPKGDGIVLAVSESSGRSAEAVRTQAHHTQTGLYQAARAYFDAHPEPKPAWHNARDGETWALTVNGSESAWAFRLHEWERVSDSLLLRGAPDSKAITAGRRIWPEEDA
jgi:hypothetical protein